MKKIVINADYGGFGLSDKAKEKYLKLSETKLNFKDFHEWLIDRDDPNLIKIIEELGIEANGKNAKLKIVEIPDNIEWTIEEYDGWESVCEKHRTWS